MILYIASYTNSHEIEKAVADSKRPVLEKMITSNFDLDHYIKQKLDNFKNLEIFIIDLSALENADEEIINAINRFRMMYDRTRVVLIAKERDRGDRLLAAFFHMGIYNLITGDLSSEDLEDEIRYCITEGKSYRESVLYKEAFAVVESGPSPVKERVIIKNEIRTAVNKTFVGIMGTQERIGVTHNAIVCANYLKSKGFKVALIESNAIKSKCLEDVKKSFDAEDTDGYFNINQIDYYPDFDFEKIASVMNRNYNFVVIDFGTIENVNISEFCRCAFPIVITGAKAWEMNNVNKVFERIKTEDFMEFYYLFNFVHSADQKSIKEEMEPIKKVFFTEYNPDPFNCNEFENLNELFKGYIPETVIHTSKESKRIDIRGLLGKCQSVFSK